MSLSENITMKCRFVCLILLGYLIIADIAATGSYC
jgi:hypothetical protein